ncbi:MAG TPA: hypothetical protein VJU79_01740 [Candidatus Dormibacteraeota bacterium]|nr:hypothetical protein [Candidatus Dormibacteraeota bacterium]
MLSGWGAVSLTRRVLSWFAAAVATMAVAAVVAPGEAHAFAWKDVCTITVINNTGSPLGLKPKGPLVQVPPNPIDEVHWTALALGIPLGGSGAVSLATIGIPVTFGCLMTPTFSWGGNEARSPTYMSCTVFAPTSGRNVFRCAGDPRYQSAIKTTILTDNADIKGVVEVGPPFVQVSGPGPVPPSSAAAPAGPKRVRSLLRRRDLPGRGWRVADKVTQFGRLGKIFAANDAPASCKDDKTSEPQAKQGGAAAFARRSSIIGYEHGVYASRRQSQQRLRAAVSAHSISCLARLLTSAQFHTRARFARYSLPGLKGVRLWRVVVRTRAGDRVTRTDYVDVAGLLHGRSNGLVLFANPKQPVSGTVQRSVIRAVARRLP